MRGLTFIKWFVYIYKVAKSVGFSFGQNKKQIKTKSFSSARFPKSVGFPKRTTHSFGVVVHIQNEMENTFKISFAVILILTIIGCQNIDKKENESVQKETFLVQMEFGKSNKQNDSLGVELDVNNFDNWFDLINRTEKIACNDSIPKITLKTDSKIKTIYFRNTCSKEDSFRIIKTKNVIAIYNNKISKNNESGIPLDSLENVLRKDIDNNGKNLDLSESSEKLTICIQYDDKSEFNSLPNILNQLTESYYRITNKTDLKILLIDENYFSPPPRPKE